MPSALGQDLANSFNKFTSGPSQEEQDQLDEEAKKKKQQDTAKKASMYLSQDPDSPMAKASQYLGN